MTVKLKKHCAGNCWLASNITTGACVLWRLYWKAVVHCFRSVAVTSQMVVVINALHVCNCACLTDCQSEFSCLCIMNFCLAHKLISVCKQYEPEKAYWSNNLFLSSFDCCILLNLNHLMWDNIYYENCV